MKSKTKKPSVIKPVFGAEVAELFKEYFQQEMLGLFGNIFSEAWVEVLKRFKKELDISLDGMDQCELIVGPDLGEEYFLHVTLDSVVTTFLQEMKNKNILAVERPDQINAMAEDMEKQARRLRDCATEFQKRINNPEASVVIRRVI